MKHTYTLTSTLPELNLENMRVLLRVDLNIPLNGTKILNDFRLKAIQPTLDLLIQKKACITIITHIGRPKDQEPGLSTQLLIPWFKKHGYQITFAPSIEDAAKMQKPSQIVLLENIRFWQEEQTGCPSLAHALRNISDIFVQDAFGVLHRNDTSVVILPMLYPEQHRTIGLLVQQELLALNKILYKPKKPVLAIIGGSKIATKLPLIKNMLTIADTVVLLPAISFSFAHAHGQSVGCSLIEPNYKSTIRAILSAACKEHKKIILPLDYIVSRNSWSGPFNTIAANQFDQQDMGITIGPLTTKLYKKYITQAKTVIFNGVSGDLSYKKTCAPMRALFKAFCDSQAYSIVAGGDSLAMLEHFKLADCVSYCSSGGGSSITYLSGQPLVGLEPFVKTK